MLELYDVQADPYETKILAGNPHYKEILQGFHTQMAQWRQQQGDHETGSYQPPKKEGNQKPVAPYIFK